MDRATSKGKMNFPELKENSLSFGMVPFEAEVNSSF
jgi:hypothetical protein